VQRAAQIGLVRRCHGREPPDDDFEFHGAGRRAVRLRTGRAVRFASSNESMAPVFYKKMAFIAFFNAASGRSTFAIPIIPTEVGYFHPLDHGGRPTSVA